MTHLVSFNNRYITVASDVFNQCFIPVRHLFDRDDECVIEAVSRSTISTVAVCILKMTSEFDSNKEMRAFKHSMLTELVSVLPDPAVDHYFTVSENPKGCYIQEFIEDLHKNLSWEQRQIDIRRSVHFVVTRMLPLLIELEKKQYDLELLNNNSVILIVSNGEIEDCKIRRNFLCHKENNYKKNLLIVAQLFSSAYSNPSRMLPIEQPFFEACHHDDVTLQQLLEFPYIVSDPNTWEPEAVISLSDDSQCSEWDVMSDKSEGMSSDEWSSPEDVYNADEESSSEGCERIDSDEFASSDEDDFPVEKDVNHIDEDDTCSVHTAIDSDSESVSTACEPSDSDCSFDILSDTEAVSVESENISDAVVDTASVSTSMESEPESIQGDDNVESSNSPKLNVSTDFQSSYGSDCSFDVISDTKSVSSTVQSEESEDDSDVVDDDTASVATAIELESDMDEADVYDSSTCTSMVTSESVTEQMDDKPVTHSDVSCTSTMCTACNAPYYCCLNGDCNTCQGHPLPEATPRTEFGSHWLSNYVASQMSNVVSDADTTSEYDEYESAASDLDSYASANEDEAADTPDNEECEVAVFEAPAVEEKTLQPSEEVHDIGTIAESLNIIVNLDDDHSNVDNGCDSKKFDYSDYYHDNNWTSDEEFSEDEHQADWSGECKEAEACCPSEASDEEYSEDETQVDSSEECEDSDELEDDNGKSVATAIEESDDESAESVTDDVPINGITLSSDGTYFIEVDTIAGAEIGEFSDPSDDDYSQDENQEDSSEECEDSDDSEAADGMSVTTAVEENIDEPSEIVKDDVYYGTAADKFPAFYMFEAPPAQRQVVRCSLSVEEITTIAKAAGIIVAPDDYYSKVDNDLNSVNYDSSPYYDECWTSSDEEYSEDENQADSSEEDKESEALEEEYSEDETQVDSSEELEDSDELEDDGDVSVATAVEESDDDSAEGVKKYVPVIGTPDVTVGIDVDTDADAEAEDGDFSEESEEEYREDENQEDPSEECEDSNDLDLSDNDDRDSVEIDSDETPSDATIVLSSSDECEAEESDDNIVNSVESENLCQEVGCQGCCHNAEATKVSEMRYSSHCKCCKHNSNFIILSPLGDYLTPENRSKYVENGRFFIRNLGFAFTEGTCLDFDLARIVVSGEYYTQYISLADGKPITLYINYNGSETCTITHANVTYTDVTNLPSRIEYHFQCFRAIVNTIWMKEHSLVVYFKGLDAEFAVSHDGFLMITCRNHDDLHDHTLSMPLEENEFLSELKDQRLVMAFKMIMNFPINPEFTYAEINL